MQRRQEDVWIEHPFTASESTESACSRPAACHPYLPTEDHKHTLFWCVYNCTARAVISSDFTAKQGSHLQGKLNKLSGSLSQCWSNASIHRKSSEEIKPWIFATKTISLYCCRPWGKCLHHLVAIASSFSTCTGATKLGYYIATF